MSDPKLTTRQLLVKALRAYTSGVLLVGLTLFVPAGTTAWWQAWTFMGVIFVPMTVLFAWLLARDPVLLERRLKTRETRAPQSFVSKLGGLSYLATFVLAGLDRRFGWSLVPMVVVIAADVIVLAGYLHYARVLLENSFASRVVEVTQGQRVITTGPYAIVRHPMYATTLAMFLPSPVALGSWWAVIPALLFLPAIVVRILDEERLMLQELDGYAEYARRTRYRLVPGVW